MKDMVVFLRNIEDEGKIIFEKDKEYEILDENKEWYYIQIYKGKNEVVKFRKSSEGVTYKFR